MSCVWNHEWEEVGRVHTKPVNALKDSVMSGTEEALRAHEEHIQRLTFGVTSVELRCKNCGTVTEELLTGDHTK